MRRQRIYLLGLIVLILMGLHIYGGLVITSAKVMGYGQIFAPWEVPVGRTTVSIGTIPADVYASSSSHSAMLIVHGVGETGNRNPTLESFARAMAASGFRVTAPEFERTARQNVTPSDIDDIVFVFKSLNADAGIACASYGCGPVLIAASRPEIRDRVRFVVTFGAYFDLTDTLRFIVTSPPTPLGYSKWIYMAANADLVSNSRDREQLLAIASERSRAPAEEWTLTAETLGPDGRAMLALFESKNTVEFDARLMKTPLLRERIERLSPSEYIDGLRADLVIVHIATDPCIPSSESYRLAAAAKARRLHHSLTILKMYGHTRPILPGLGTQSLFDFYLPEGLRFMSVLNAILSYA